MLIKQELTKKNTRESSMLINKLSTPLVAMVICATKAGVCLLEFEERKELAQELKDLQRLLKTSIITGENEHIQQAKRELEAYFVGTLQQFEVTLHTSGTPFQQTAWQGLATIPYGQTISYKKQAQKPNKPTAIRSIVRANGVAIILPCHRVVGSDGALRGYARCLERKQWLLDHEKRGLE